MKPEKTIHTSRTMMFAELAKVMNHGIESDNYYDTLKQNVISKATQSGLSKTSRYLKSLYDFDASQPQFMVFKYFWSIATERDKPILAIIYAIGNDYLLKNSIPVINNTEIGKKVTVESVNIHQKYTINIHQKWYTFKYH